MERKLASIQRVSELRPIEGADAIECAVVQGWNVVVKKGEFKPGDLCVFFEIDSFLPADDPRYYFLANKFTWWNGHQGARLRTIKLRGHLSQGLALPLSSFPELIVEVEQYHSTEDAVGWDATELLRIQKWEAPIPAQLAGKVRGGFPHFLRKTDQERVQNLWNGLMSRAGNDESKEPYKGTFEVTQKLDGSSMTAYLYEDKFGICSRNLDLVETEENAFWTVARKLELELKLRYAAQRAGFVKGLAVQGELLGPGIQGNPEQLKDLNFYVFDVFDIDNQRYLSPWERSVLHSECFHGVEHVPVLDVALDLNTFETLDRLLAFADGASAVCSKNTRREGLVFKSNQNDGFSFKAISNRFLLTEK